MRTIQNSKLFIRVEFNLGLPDLLAALGHGQLGQPVA
jgi:hypothetical protein